MSDQEEKIPFTSHLEELRSRIIVSFIAIGIGFVLAFSVKEWLFELLIAPLISAMRPGEKLIFTSLPEAFFVYLKVAFLSGTFLAIPVILYQFWMFIAPGLYSRERRYLAPIMVLSIFFFIAGALFGYFVVFPIGFKFFLSFATDNIQPLLTMKEFLSFATLFLLAFGLMFELPLVMIFLVKLGIISIDFLTKNRKYAILIIFIIAAILTPPDVISQTLMAIPMMALYEIGILGARIFARKKPQEDPAEDAPVDTPEETP